MEQLLPKVALDSSMLLAMFESTVDVFESIRDVLGKVEFVVPKQVILELNGMKERNQKMKIIHLILELLEKKKVKEIEVEARDADSALLKLAKEGFYVATNDKALKVSIKKINGKLLFLRDERAVEIG